MAVPSWTWLESMSTPPSSTGRPVMSTVSSPSAPLLRAVLSRTVTRPVALGLDWPIRPVRRAVNGGLENAAAGGAVVVVVGVAAAAAGAAAAVPPPRRLRGVPAWRAQPFASGPPVSQTNSNAGATMLAVRPATRSPRWSGHPAATRHQTASTTARTHATFTTSTNESFESVPAPNPCSTTSGQQRYDIQWTTRHVRAPMRCRSRLVIVSASTRSNAMAPNPSHSDR